MIQVDFSRIKKPARINPMRAKREQDIISAYKRGLKERPDIAKSAIMKAIAEATGYKSHNSIYYILHKHNEL